MYQGNWLELLFLFPTSFAIIQTLPLRLNYRNLYLSHLYKILKRFVNHQIFYFFILDGNKQESEDIKLEFELNLSLKDESKSSKYGQKLDTL